MGEVTLVYLDCETTGLDPHRHAVWEIAFAIEDGPVQSSIVHPGFWCDIDREASKINGFDERYVEPAGGAWCDWEATLRGELVGATVVASNPSFDCDFLYRRWGAAPWHHRKIDISTYGLPLYREMSGLAGIAERLGIEPPDDTAAQDVATLRGAFLALQRIYAGLLP